MAEGEIAFDAEAHWDGNCSCILSVGLPMGVALPAQVGSLSMSMCAPIGFHELIENEWAICDLLSL